MKLPYLSLSYATSVRNPPPSNGQQEFGKVVEVHKSCNIGCTWINWPIFMLWVQFHLLPDWFRRNSISAFILYLYIRPCTLYNRPRHRSSIYPFHLGIPVVHIATPTSTTFILYLYIRPCTLCIHLHHRSSILPFHLGIHRSSYSHPDLDPLYYTSISAAPVPSISTSAIVPPSAPSTSISTVVHIATPTSTTEIPSVVRKTESFWV